MDITGRRRTELRPQQLQRRRKQRDVSRNQPNSTTKASLYVLTTTNPRSFPYMRNAVQDPCATAQNFGGSKRASPSRFDGVSPDDYLVVTTTPLFSRIPVQANAEKDIEHLGLCA